MITKVKRLFSYVGKGVKQVHLRAKDAVEVTGPDGTKSFEFPLLYEEGKDANGNPIKVPQTGNEQYEADQLTDDSVSDKDPEAFMVDVLEATGSDLSKAAEAFREGWNLITRRETGGQDPYVSAAKRMIQLGLFKGQTVDQIADTLRKANAAA
jgi:hypothetical protein